MNHEFYISKAIEIAKISQKSGGVAIGAVLVDKSGKTVAEGMSNVGITKDPTSHAEVNCIRSLSQQINNDDLFAYTLYCTLEPCHMCLSAAAWAKINEVYFGAYRKDVDESLFDIIGGIDVEQEARRMNLRENIKMKAEGGILEIECAKLLKGYHEVPRYS